IFWSAARAVSGRVRRAGIRLAAATTCVGSSTATASPARPTAASANRLAAAARRHSDNLGVWAPGHIIGPDDKYDGCPLQAELLRALANPGGALLGAEDDTRELQHAADGPGVRGRRADETDRGAGGQRAAKQNGS